MKLWIGSLSVALIVGSASAEPEKLKPVDLQELRERLKKLEEGAQGRKTTRLSKARTAMTAGVKSDAAAFDLYLKCVERVEYQEADRSAQAFREWKRRNKDKMGDKFQRARRHQINWLLLVVEAAMSPDKKIQHGREAMDRLDSMLGDLEEMGKEGKVLEESVLESVFAATYGLSGIALGENWPYAPMKVEDVYENLVFPPLRNPKGVGLLRAAWKKRIQHEELMATQRGENKDDLRNVDTPAKLILFRSDKRPELVWAMEVDLFKAGDERAAALRMVGHIEKHLGHKSEKQWVEELQALVSAEDEEPTAATE